MCRPVSLLMSPDTIHTPPSDAWDHHHSRIAKDNGIPDKLIGDKWVRVEVLPPGEVFRDPDTNAVCVVDDTWTVDLDEQRRVDWWDDDRPAQEHRAREAAKRWLKSFPANLVPRHRAIGGGRSTLTGGDHSTLTGGEGSTLTGGDYSTLCWRIWDATHRRIIVAYVGENGIKANTPYTLRDGTVVEAAQQAAKEGNNRNA